MCDCSCTSGHSIASAATVLHQESCVPCVQIVAVRSIVSAALTAASIARMRAGGSTAQVRQLLDGKCTRRRYLHS